MAGAQGIRAGRAYVELGMSDKLTAGLRRAQARLRAFGAGVTAIGRQTFIAGAAAGAALLGATRAFAKAGDTVEKMSRRTGFSAEALSELGFAAEQSGSNLETLEKGVRTMQRSINDAGRGLSTAVDGFADLGLTFGQLQGMSPEEQFKLVADRLSQISDPSKRAALAMMLFGRAGTQLLPMMEDGASGMEKLMKQARAMGLTISSEAAARAAALTDTLNILWRVVKVVTFQIGSALEPIVSGAAKAITRIAVRTAAWISENQGLVRTVLLVAAGVASAGAGLLALGVAVKVAAFACGGLATALAVVKAAVVGVGVVLGGMLSPIGLVVTAVAGLGAAVLIYSGKAGDALKWLSAQFTRLRGFVGDVVGGITDALAAGDPVLAAQVLWAGLKVAWETGIKPLRDLWNDFRFAFEEIGINAFAGLKKGWIEVSTWMWKNFPETTAFIAKTWTELGSTLQTVWANFQNWLSDRWLEVMGMFDESLDVEAAQALGREDLASQLTQIEADRKAALAEADRKKGLSEAEHEKEKAASLKEVDDERKKALATLEKEHSERIKAAQDELQAAKGALKAAREKARLDREKAEAETAPGSGKSMRDALKEGGEATKQAMAQLSIHGTFNPYASFGLGKSSAAERTARAAEGTHREVKELNRKATTGGLTFAS